MLPMESLATADPELAFAARTRDLRGSAIREMLKVTQLPDIISFAGGLPAPELFPVAGVIDASKAVFEHFGHMPLQYSLTEGIPQLREWVAARLNSLHQANFDAEEIIITGGSQQGLDLIAKIFLDPGDVVVIENPTYLAAIQAFSLYEATYLAIPTDAEGMIPEALEAALHTAKKRPKFMYLVPSFQNPTGLTLSDARRPAILKICERFELPIVEDDPYGELRFEGAEIRPLAARASRGTIIYLGTGSKILAPGLRIAWMAVRDARIREKIIPAKQAADLHTGTFAQYVFWEFARHAGVIERQVATIRKVYRARRDAMVEALRSTFGERLQYTIPQGGMFLWATLCAGTDTEALLPVASAEKVVFVPGVSFFPNREVHNAMRLNFSNSSEESIRTGIERLALALEKFAGRSHL